MKNNIIETENKFYKIYLMGFFVILSLPIWAFPPIFYPPEWGKSIAFKIVLSAILFLITLRALYEKKFWQELVEKIKSQKWLILLLFFSFLALLISTLLSPDKLFSLWTSPHRAGGAVNFIFLLLLAPLLFLTIKKSDWPKLWDFSFLIGDLAALFAMVQYFNLLPSIFLAYGGRPPSTLSNSILFALYLILLLFPSLHLTITDRTKKRAFYLASLILYVFGILASGSRAAYIAMFLGSIYFLVFYPFALQNNNGPKQKFLKKAPLLLKIAAIILVLSVIFCIYLANSDIKLPQFLENNGIVSMVKTRLSFNLLKAEPRFSAWQVAWQALKEKPFFGWGPENFAMAFDKYYDPSLPFITKDWGAWWDRAHNIFFDMAVCNGLIFTIIYFFFFGFLLYKLPKTRALNDENKISSHAIKAVFIGYFSAVFFGFDSISTYIVLFFIIGYSLTIATKKQAPEPITLNQKSSSKWFSFNKNRKLIITFLVIFLLFFIWKYNLKPLFINIEMNLADKLITADNCRDGISKIENLFNKKSFLDAYIRMKYVDELKACENSISISEQTEYAKKIINALKVSAKIRPLYARNWIMLGSFNAVLVVSEKDKEKKEELIKEVDSYFEKALSMAPRHQEVFSEWARAYFAAGEYQKMKEKSEQCIALNEDCNSCYWYLGLAEILLNDIKSGKENIEIARAKRFPVETEQYLNQLALIYTKNRNDKELVLIYESLIKLVPENVQYHASLAFLYKELGYYGEASKYAMKVLQLQPENTEALNFAESMLYYDSNDPIIYTSLGYIYGQLGEDEKSRQEFLTAKSIYLQLIANYYKNPKNHFKLAEIYKNLGEYENAIRETLIYVDLDPNKGVMNQAEEFLNTLPLPKEKIDLKLLRPNLYK